MTNIPQDLLCTFENLGQEDLKKFQWHLITGVEGFTPIPKAPLENADRPDTVDEIVQRYGHSGAVKVTLSILKKINQNQLSEELRTKHSEGKETSSIKRRVLHVLKHCLP